MIQVDYVKPHKENKIFLSIMNSKKVFKLRTEDRNDRDE